MDTKLKNSNNIIIKSIKIIKNKLSDLSINKKIWAISICISVFSVLLAMLMRHPYINNRAELISGNADVRKEITEVTQCIDELNHLMLYSHKHFRQEAINEQVDILKWINRDNIEKAKSKREAYVQNNNIDEAKISSGDKYYEIFNNKVVEAEKEYNKSYSEYEKEAINRIKDKISELDSLLNKKQLNVEYYMRSSENNVITNIPGKSSDEIIKETLSGDYKDYVILDNIYNDVAETRYISESMESFVNMMKTNKTYTKIIRISKDLKDGDAIYNILKDVDKNNNIFIISSIGVILELIIFFCLIFSMTKEKLYEENIISKLYSRLFIEIKIIILILVFIALFSIYEYSLWKVDLFILLTAGITSILLYAVISDLYKKTILRDDKGLKFISADESILMRMYREKYYKSKNMDLNINVLKLVICFIGYHIIIGYTLINVGYHKLPWGGSNDTTISFLVISITITIAVIAYMIIKCINLCNIKNGLEKIIQGNYIDNIKIYGFGIEKNIADDILNIKEGFSKAIDDAVKSERMKSELITNVSHDLKTPLTSIINYVDLLSKEGVTENDKEKYLAILSERSQRLKVLIEDLFEASKAASGALELKYETLDPAALIRQVLGELNDRISDSGLEFIKNFPEEKVYIVADGRKTFRIIQNLISNILKYSLDKSRVYIDVIEEEGNILMVLKNISRYRLNCGEEELMERFKRGDSSRTTEGNGLGLSIAKSLTEAQGGKFNINIDGDLFKVEVRLKKK